MIFADAQGNAHARRWTNRQSGRSAVRASTSTVLIVAEALHATAAQDMPRLLATLTTEISAAWQITPAWGGAHLLHDAGRPHGLVPVGIGVYGTTARLEKGYRAFGAELTPEYDPVEAGMTRPAGEGRAVHRQGGVPRGPDGDARGGTVHADRRRALVRRRDSPVHALGGEPILTLTGARLVDAHGRPSVVTSAGSGPSVGRHLLMAYLPAELSATGTPLLVEYMGEQYPVTVASHGAVFDPAGAGMR